MTMATLTAVIQKEDDLFIATCAELGTISQGSTLEKAIANLKEATELYLEEFPQKALDLPVLQNFEVAERVKA
mgnify:FL=1